MRRFAAIAVATLFGLILLVVIGVFVFEAAYCGNQPVQTLLSPDRQWKAVLFERGCAGIAFTSQVSVIAADSELRNQLGNAFMADLRNGGTPASWGGPAVELEWNNDGSLEIRYDHEAYIAKQESKVGTVSIVYGQE